MEITCTDKEGSVTQAALSTDDPPQVVDQMRDELASAYTEQPTDMSPVNVEIEQRNLVAQTEASSFSLESDFIPVSYKRPTTNRKTNIEINGQNPSRVSPYNNKRGRVPPN